MYKKLSLEMGEGKKWLTEVLQNSVPTIIKILKEKYESLS